MDIVESQAHAECSPHVLHDQMLRFAECCVNKPTGRDTISFTAGDFSAIQLRAIHEHVSADRADYYITEDPPGVLAIVFTPFQELFDWYYQAKSAERVVVVSDDGRSVKWSGHPEAFEFTPIQAACFNVLYRNWKQGTPTLDQSTILESAGSNSDSGRLRDVFKGHPAWNTLIVGSRKGTFRLAPKPPETSG